MIGAELMFNEALNSLLSTDYYDHIFDAYPKEIAQRVLNGYVCDLFSNETSCRAYRN